MNTTLTLMPSDAVAQLTTQAERLPTPYLITGAQAAYLYHHWLRPIAKMVNLCILADALEQWRSVLAAPWLVCVETPTLTQVRPASCVAILEVGLTEALYQRRVMYDSLAFMSPEDVCLQLLEKANTTIALSELAALLIAQKDKLDWSYLQQQTNPSQRQRLADVIHAINTGAGYMLLTPPNLNIQNATQPTSTFIRPEMFLEVLRPTRAQWQMAHADLVRN